MRSLKSIVVANVLLAMVSDCAWAQDDQHRIVPPDAFFIHNRLPRSVQIELLPDGIRREIPAQEVQDFPCHRITEVRVESDPKNYSVECENRYAVTGRKEAPFVRLTD
jgi:hypothetical protein